MQDSIQINSLEPIIAPEPVSFWPPAPGWYILAALVLLLLLYGIYRAIKKYQKNQYRRLALKELAGLSFPTNSEQFVQSVSALNVLMKRTALAGFSRERVAGLSGMNWLNFLETTYPSGQFKQSPGKFLAEIGYVSEKNLELQDKDWQELIYICEKWIRHHRT